MSSFLSVNNCTSIIVSLKVCGFFLSESLHQESTEIVANLSFDKNICLVLLQRIAKYQDPIQKW